MSTAIEQEAPVMVGFDGLDSPEFGQMLERKLAELGPEPDEEGGKQAAADGQEGAEKPGGELPQEAAKPQPDQTGTLDGAKTPEKQESKPAEPEADEKGADGKPLSRWEKEQRRLARNRREFEEEKKREREAIKAEREALAKERAEIESARAALKQDPAASPETWEKYAVKLEEEGRYEDAELAKAEAKRLRDEMAQAPEREREMQLRAAHKESTARALKEIPELGNAASPLRAAYSEFLRQNPDVLQHPNGPYWAAMHVRAAMAASRVPELEKKLQAESGEVEKLKAKIKELEALTAVSGGGASGSLPLASRSDDDMSLEELRAAALLEARGN